MTDKAVIKLPIWKTARETYRYTRRHLSLLLLPVLLLFITEASTTYLTLLAKGHMWLEMRPVWPVLSSVIEFSFVVGLHRTVMLGEEFSGAAFFRWDRHLGRYGMAALKLSFGLLAIAIVLLWLTHGYLAKLHSLPIWQHAAVAALILPLAYLILRVSLAFPAAALGKDRLFRLSWRATRGNTARLLATYLLVAITALIAGGVVLIPFLIAGALVGLERDIVKNALAVLSDSVIETVATVLLTVMISLSYQILVPPRLTEPGPEDL
jgi:hypothetical protein